MKGQVRQFLAATIVNLGVLSLGGALSWTSTSVAKIQNDQSFGNITSQDVAWISSTATLGALISSPLAGLSVDFLGRKQTMLLLALPFFSGWVLMGLSKNVLMLCIGRLFTGLSGGGFAVAAPVYISEIAEDSIRGVLSSFFQLMLVIGILFTDVLGSTSVSWECVALISSGFPILFFFLIFLLPESPRGLLLFGKLDEAKRALYWFRGHSLSGPFLMHDKSVEQELAATEESVKNSSCLSSWTEIFHAPMRRPILICLSLVIFKSPVIIVYAFNVFRSSNTSSSSSSSSSSASSIDSNLSICVVAAVQVLATILSAYLVDRVGRRKLLISSEAVMALSLFVIGAWHWQLNTHGVLVFNHQTSDNGVPDLSSHVVGQQLEWLPLVSLIFFIVSFSIGAGPIAWVIQGEILPLKIRGFCQSIATTFVWLLAFLITNTYGLLVEEIGFAFSFWFFSVICLIGTIVVILFVPETKGKSLMEIELMFA